MTPAVSKQHSESNQWLELDFKGLLPCNICFLSDETHSLIGSCWHNGTCMSQQPATSCSLVQQRTWHACILHLFLLLPQPSADRNSHVVVISYQWGDNYLHHLKFCGEGRKTWGKFECACLHKVLVWKLSMLTFGYSQIVHGHVKPKGNMQNISQDNIDAKDKQGQSFLPVWIKACFSETASALISFLKDNWQTQTMLDFLDM